MGNYICLNNIIITILTTSLFVSCKPTEPMLELQLEKQAIGEAFFLPITVKKSMTACI